MSELRPLITVGIHPILDEQIEESYEVWEAGDRIGFVSFRELEKSVAMMEFVLAENPGEGQGRMLVQAVFEQGYKQVEGLVSYGPHLFWQQLGARFSEQPLLNKESVHFILAEKQFYQ